MTNTAIYDESEQLLQAFKMSGHEYLKNPYTNKVLKAGLWAMYILESVDSWGEATHSFNSLVRVRKAADRNEKKQYGKWIVI